jgi:hypothetical protein
VPILTTILLEAELPILSVALSVMTCAIKSGFPGVLGPLKTTLICSPVPITPSGPELQTRLVPVIACPSASCACPLNVIDCPGPN